MYRGQKQARRTENKGVRLFLEELESRSMLSATLSPVGGITFGPDGNIWFPAGNQIAELNPTTGVITEVNLPSRPGFEGQIVAGPDGNLWFGGWNQIEKVNPATGAVQSYSIPGVFPAMSGGTFTFDKDGFLWFTSGNSALFMSRLDPSTVQIQQFNVPGTNFYNPYGVLIATGADGGIWYVASSGSIDRFDPATQTVRQFSIPYGAYGLASGPDGDIYFTTSSKSLIGRIDPGSGAVQMIGNVDRSGPSVMDNWRPAYSFAFGPDGTVWTIGSGAINQFNPATGYIQSFSQSVGQAMVLDANGNFWFPSPDPILGFSSDNWRIGRIEEFNPTTGAVQFFDLSTGTQNSNNGSSSSSASGTTFNATAGINFETAVAFFTPKTPVPSPGTAYRAIVDWGDGSNSIVVFTVTDGSTYSVVANHIYQTAGTYKVKVTISPFSSSDPLSGDSVTVFSTANVVANNWNLNPYW